MSMIRLIARENNSIILFSITNSQYLECHEHVLVILTSQKVNELDSSLRLRFFMNSFLQEINEDTKKAAAGPH